MNSYQIFQYADIENKFPGAHAAAMKQETEDCYVLDFWVTDCVLSICLNQFNKQTKVLSDWDPIARTWSTIYPFDGKRHSRE